MAKASDSKNTNKGAATRGSSSTSKSSGTSSRVTASSAGRSGSSKSASSAKSSSSAKSASSAKSSSSAKNSSSPKSSAASKSTASSSRTVVSSKSGTVSKNTTVSKSNIVSKNSPALKTSSTSYKSAGTATKSTQAKSASSKSRKTNIKKGKVKLNTRSVITLCAVICIFCGLLIFIATMSGRVSSMKANVQEEIAATNIKPSTPESSNIDLNPPRHETILPPPRVDDAEEEEELEEEELEEDSVEEIEEIKKDDGNSNQMELVHDPIYEPIIVQPEPVIAQNTESKKEEKTSGAKQPSVPESAMASTSTKANPSSSASANTTTATSASTSKTVAPVVPSTSTASVSPGTSGTTGGGSKTPVVVPYDIPQAKNGATLVFVIDDAGQNVANVKKYAALPFPITIAVLPKLAHSKDAAYVVRSNGKELILHQPMQSLNLNLYPGPGSITPDMSTSEIAALVKENLDEIGPNVKGLNNHEGSLITENEIKIGAVLEVVGERNIYFLDSRTTAQTKAPQAALERDMSIKERDVFIDDIVSREEMLKQIYRGLDIANKKGKAIMIGHVDKSVNILPDLLQDMYPYLIAKGYKFSTPSAL